jgi:hypothetical protein
MMKVYLAYECYDTGDEWPNREVANVFSSEDRAKEWVTFRMPTESRWREYEEMEVE